MSGRRIFTRPARLAALAPYLWMALFFLVPVILFGLPFLVRTVLNTVQKAFDIYGIDISPLWKDAWQTLIRYLPLLIGSLF